MQKALQCSAVLCLYIHSIFLFLNLILTNVLVSNIYNGYSQYSHSLQDIYKAYYKLLALQYLDDTPKTCGSDRVASIFMLAVNASECVKNMSNIVQ